jgi:TraY domain
MQRQRSVVEEKRKSAGRPRQEPEEGARVVLSFRITPELKRLLDAAADQSGRSMSQECELRLEKSFERDRISAGFSRLQAGLDALVVAFRQGSFARGTSLSKSDLSPVDVAAHAASAELEAVWANTGQLTSKNRAELARVRSRKKIQK